MADKNQDSYKKLKTFTSNPAIPKKGPGGYSICNKCKIACGTDKCHRCFKRRKSLLSP